MVHSNGTSQTGSQTPTSEMSLQCTHAHVIHREKETEIDIQKETEGDRDTELH